MKPVDSPQEWVIRLLRIAAVALFGAAIALWITPVNAPGRNLVPVGCGSPAAPAADPLSDYVCRDLVGGAKGIVVAAAVAGAILLLLSEAAVPKLPGRSWLSGAAVAAVLAVPLFTLSATTLGTTVAASGADGTLIRCGTPLAPAVDSISKRMCGQLAQRDKTLALAGMGLAILTLVGAGYIANGRRPEDGFNGRRPHDEGISGRGDRLPDDASPRPASPPEGPPHGTSGADATPPTASAPSPHETPSGEDGS